MSKKQTSQDSNNDPISSQTSNRLKPGEVAELDYSKIDIPTEVTRMSISGVNLQALAWLNVSGYLLKKSLSQMAQTALYTYLARNRQSHLRMLVTEAKQRGKSIEQTFQEIVNETMRKDKIKGKSKD